MLLMDASTKYIFCYTIREYQREREEHNMAVMQMVVVVVFVLCNCLAMVSNILEASKVEAVRITQVSNLLVTINSSINIFIYCVFGKRFRLELKRLISKVPCATIQWKLCPNPSNRFKTMLKKTPEPAAYYTRDRVTIVVSVPIETSIHQQTTMTETVTAQEV